jgi:hypothetical protein
VRLEWIPEINPPSGTIGAAGFVKLLGRPQLDPLTVLVRETAQNSWDAKDDSGLPVRFEIAGRVLSVDEVQTLKESVFVGHEKLHGSRLNEILLRSEVTALYLSDRQTKGLGGPLLANIVDEAEDYNWVGFVLNVGVPNSQANSGGTYGFGKAIAYVVSEAKSIVVYSRTKYRGAIVSRLMACGIGEKFSRDSKWFTGRHWWGVSSGGSSLPLEGNQADDLAKALGMPEFGAEELGTTIMILQPNFGERPPLQAMNFIAETALWQLWPKIVTRLSTPAMEVKVSWNGAEVPIPSPEDRPPLQAFVTAFRALGDPDTGDVTLGLDRNRIQRFRAPKTVIGELVTLPMVFRERAVIDDGHDPDDPESPAPSVGIKSPRCHHVALLRAPELVVEYLEGPPAPESGFEWAGVFRVDDNHDETFGKSEPPTHDSWQPELIESRTDRALVKKALRDIRIAVGDRWGERRTPAGVSASSTSVVADRLAHLVGVSDGSAAEALLRERVNGPRTNHAKVEQLSAGPVMVGARLGTSVRVRITPKQGSFETRVCVSVGVALDGSSAGSSFDSDVKLVSASCLGKTRNLGGAETDFVIGSATPTEVDIIASRLASHSLLFNISAQARADDGTWE